MRLPVSGIEVQVRQPGGTEDVLLAEAPAFDVALALALAGSVASPADGGTPAWEALPHTDLDALLLLIRATLFGDLVRATVRCRAAGCEAQVSVTFSTAEYLAHHRPRPAPGVEPHEPPGWFRLPAGEVRFRLPTAGDLVAVRGQPRPERALLARCVVPDRLPAPLRRRVERAMERLAPSLVGDLAGECPECGAAIAMRFDPLQFCLRELSDQAAAVFEDVHLLASVYHWPEPHILSLPRRRRVQYAEMARAERRPA